MVINTTVPAELGRNIRDLLDTCESLLRDKKQTDDDKSKELIAELATMKTNLGLLKTRLNELIVEFDEFVADANELLESVPK